ncbi:MAG: ATP-binding protein [Akkermansiaceae bacterium]
MKPTITSVTTLQLLVVLSFSLLIGATQSSPALNLKQLDKASLSGLEQRAATINKQLEQLAHYSMRSGVGAISYRSKPYSEPNHTEWVQIELGQETHVDQIILVPALWRDTKAGFISDGFPVRFKITAGIGKDTSGTVIASFSKEDELLPRIAPLVIPCSITASWVRVEVTELSARLYDGKYNLELAEILIFNGQENMALHRPLTTSSDTPNERGARKKSFLVDGFSPYLMDSGRGIRSIAFLGRTKEINQPSITLDLENTHPLNRIHLHSLDFSHTVPHATPAGFATPLRILVEGANRADFSDAISLVKYHQKSIYDRGPIIIRRFPETPCRYVRLTATQPYIFEEEGESRYLMGFAEIELFSKGLNVAANKIAVSNLMQNPQQIRSIESLTDSSNLYGQILPTRQWMQELALRHELEKELPLINQQINHRYTDQKTLLRRMIWLVALLIVGIGFMILIGRMLRMRQATRIKERFAADLHDELGANLHTIGLLSDLSKQMIHAPEKLTKLLDRIRDFTERSGTAARNCTNILEAKGICEDLVDEMTRSSRRLLTDLKYDISFSGENLLLKLTPRRRIDLFLFFKECLTNILRHSGATQVSIDLTAEKNNIILTITDNGHGIESEKDTAPASLRRRARLLGGRAAVEHPFEGGSTITLKLKIRQFRIRL